MNTQANAIPGGPLDSEPTVPAAMSATRPFYWSLRRELWEYRSIYLGPLSVSCVALLGFLIATIGRALATGNSDERLTVLAQPYEFAESLPMLTAMIVGAFYCLDAFYSERRDRSILFWKSLPVSDRTTVLAKASIPYLVLPAITCGLMVVIELIMVALSSLVVMGSGMSVGTFLTRLAPVEMLTGMLYHMITVHVLWHAPFYAWMMLVSAWARRATFLWAVLPPLAIAVFERIAFHTTHLGNFMMYRLEGGTEAMPMPGRNALDLMTRLTPGHFLLTPGLWFGLAFTALCLFGAMRLRRQHGPL
jgi:ABC-2 type transport system permease protein